MVCIKNLIQRTYKNQQDNILAICIDSGIFWAIIPIAKQIKQYNQTNNNQLLINTLIYFNHEKIINFDGSPARRNDRMPEGASGDSG